MTSFFAASMMLVTVSEACSNFYMDYTNASFRLSARTMDLGDMLDWEVNAMPRGQKSDVLGTSWVSKYGYVAFTPRSVEVLNRNVKIDGIDLGIFTARDIVSEGMNEAGLTCSFLTLTNSSFQAYNWLHPSRNIMSYSLCKWALENFASVAEVQAALPQMHVFLDTAIHFAFQDTGKKILVAEFINKEQLLHEDLNDGVDTFGIMTNEPRFEWQLQNVKHLEWKRTLSRSAVSVPGNWYPDERFLRVHLVKSAIEKTNQPTSYREAVARVVAILNTVTVPMGDIPGTDSEAAGGEGLADHTQWGVIRDHANKEVYLRSQTNPSFRRIRLAELQLDEGAAVTTMEIEQDPWFLDVSSAFKANVLSTLAV